MTEHSEKVECFVEPVTGACKWRAHWWTDRGYSTSTHTLRSEALAVALRSGGEAQADGEKE